MPVSKRALKLLLVAAATAVGGTILGRLLGYDIGMNTPVRCREGHLYSTIWIPGVKLKGLDFGIARFQHCPVGHHWSLVVPVRRASLSSEEAALSASRHDIAIP